MDSFGETIRKLRKEKALPLRSVAAYLDIDQAILSKIERGQRIANRNLVIKLAEYFEVKKYDLLVSWLSDKLVYQIAEEDIALKALQAAEEKIAYRNTFQKQKKTIVKVIADVLQKDGRTISAWLYGSTAREEDQVHSDVDLIIELNKNKVYSIFDLIDIAHKVEQKINRKVDLVERGQIKNFAINTAKQDLIKIYG